MNSEELKNIIEKAVKNADRKEAVFISHEDVCKWLNQWGTFDEKPIALRDYNKL